MEKGKTYQQNTSALSDRGHAVPAYMLHHRRNNRLQSLAGRPYIHENYVVPSTLHQCFKYVGEDLKVHQFANKNSFHGLEAHYTDAALYALVGEEKLSKGKEISAVVPTRRRTSVKEGLQVKTAKPGNATNGMNEALQKLNQFPGIVIPTTKLNARPELPMQPQP